MLKWQFENKEIEKVFNTLQDKYKYYMNNNNDNAADKLIKEFSDYLTCKWRIGEITTSEQAMIEALFIWTN